MFKNLAQSSYYFFQMKVIEFFNVLLVLTNAYILNPTKTNSFWDQRRNLKEKELERNNFLDALKRSMSYKL